MHTPLNTPRPTELSAYPKGSLFRQALTSVLLFSLGLVVMVFLGYIAKMVMGQEFLHALSSSELSTYLMLFFAFAVLVHVIIFSTSSVYSSMWTPIKLTLLAAWIIPSMPGPVGEKISPLAALLLQVLS